MFKDEARGKQISHFVGLSAKLYSYKLEGENEQLKAKLKGLKETLLKILYHLMITSNVCFQEKK